MSDGKCVCVFSNFYPPVVSGSSVQVEGLCRELVKQGWKVIVISAHVVSESAHYEVVDGIHVHRLPSLRLPSSMTLGFNFPWLGITFKPANIKRINQILKKYQPDIIHLHNYMFDLALSAVYAKLKYKIPMTLTIHTYLRHPSPPINVVFYLIEKLLLKWMVIRQASCVICPDANVMKYTLREFGNIQTALVPYGIHLSTPPANAKADLIKRFKLEGKRIILSVGHLHAMRNRRDLFLAMPHILKKIPNAIFLVIGDISIQIPERIKNSEVDSAVILAGPLQHAEVSALLEIADIEAHWLNQDKPEKTSLGIASLEAMSAGLTVLAAANPDTYGKGVLVNGKNIIIVQPDQIQELADTIIDLLGNDSRRHAIGAHARQIVLEHFSWDSVGSQTVHVYESVIEEKKVNLNV